MKYTVQVTRDVEQALQFDVEADSESDAIAEAAKRYWGGDDGRVVDTAAVREPDFADAEAWEWEEG